MNVARSLLDVIKNQITSMVWTYSKNGRGEITKRSYEMEPNQEEENEVDLNLPGRKGLDD